MPQIKAQGGKKKALVEEIQKAVQQEAQKKAQNKLGSGEDLLYIKVHIKF